MTLHTQIPITVETYMEFVAAAFGRMTARTGHHLAGARVEDILSNGMSKRPMQPMAFIADLIDGGLDHVRMVRAVRCMAVSAGACQFVLEFCRNGPLEGVLVAGTADVALLAFEQPLLIAGVRRMASGTTVFPVPHQMIVGGRHLFLDIIMTAKAGIDAYRNTLAFMAIIAAFGIGGVQDILDHCRPVAAMGAVTGRAILHFQRKVGVLLLDQLRRVTALAELLDRLDKQVIIDRLMRIMAGGALAFGIWRMGVLELLGQIGMAGEAETGATLLEQFVRIG
jgi:hypothetical protein